MAEEQKISKRTLENRTYRRRRARNTTVDKSGLYQLSDALKLRMQGLTLKQVAATLGVSETVIGDRLKPFEVLVRDPHSLEIFRSREAELLDGVRQLALQAIVTQLSDEERAKRLDLNRLSMLYGVIFDKMRLLRGESTANVSALAKLITDAHSMRGSSNKANGAEPSIEAEHSTEEQS